MEEEEKRVKKRIVRVVRKKQPVVDKGPRVPTKQKVVILRKVRDNEDYVHKEEIPVSIGIPEYFNELKEADREKEEREQIFGKKIIIFLIGGPGSGKGTQAERILKDFDIGYMSAGELLRQETSSGSELGTFISEQMKLGNILPQEIVINLLKKEIIKQDKEQYLIDGFPRKIDQAETFEKNVCSCALALFLDVPDDILVERLIGRSQDSGREDDNPETIKLRIKTFHEISEQVFDYFNPMGKAIKIDGNRDPDSVYEDVKNAISAVIAKNSNSSEEITNNNNEEEEEYIEPEQQPNA
ncbi:hypothetical protein M9Y10_018833 [Tritrichomonas musculus]|uniref:Adenylate kinase n=1 Tax=Tritrichomonas musculus TaxID=1915356 RepID=A0ABR2HHX4_9EUKA